MVLPHQFFKLVSDETRLRCVLLIAREQRVCVCELTHALQESQPKISRHLAQLRQSGILIDERNGAWVYYQLSPTLPGWLRKIIDDLRASECLKNTYLNDIQRLSQMASRSCNDVRGRV